MDTPALDEAVKHMPDCKSQSLRGGKCDCYSDEARAELAALKELLADSKCPRCQVDRQVLYRCPHCGSLEAAVA